MSKVIDLTEAITTFLSSSAPIDESVQRFMADIGGMTVLLEILVNTPVTSVLEEDEEAFDSLADRDETPVEHPAQLDPDLLLADTITRIASKVLSVSSARSLLLSTKASALIGAMLADAVVVTEAPSGIPPTSTETIHIQPQAPEVHNSLRAGVRLHGALILLKGIYQAVQDAVRASAGDADGPLLPAATFAVLLSTLRSRHDADAPLVELCTDILALEAHYSADAARRLYGAGAARVLLGDAAGAGAGAGVGEDGTDNSPAAPTDPLAGGLGVWTLPSAALATRAHLLARAAARADPGNGSISSGVMSSGMSDEDLRIPGVDEALAAQESETSSELYPLHSFSLTLPFSRSGNTPTLHYTLTFSQISCPDTLRARMLALYLAPLSVAEALLPPPVTVTQPSLVADAPVLLSLSSLRVLALAAAADVVPVLLHILDPSLEHDANASASSGSAAASTAPSSPVLGARVAAGGFVARVVHATSAALRTFAGTLAAAINLRIDPDTTSHAHASSAAGPTSPSPPSALSAWRPHTPAGSGADPLSSLVLFDLLAGLAKAPCGLALLSRAHVFYFLFETLRTLAPAEPPTAQRASLHGVSPSPATPGSPLPSAPRLMLDSDEEEAALAGWSLRGYGSLWVSHALKTAAFVAEQLAEHPFPGYAYAPPQHCSPPSSSPSSSSSSPAASASSLRALVAYPPSALGWLLESASNPDRAVDNSDNVHDLSGDGDLDDSLSFLVSVADLLAGYLCIPSLFSVVANTVSSLAATLPDKMWLWMPHATAALLRSHYTASTTVTPAVTADSQAVPPRSLMSLTSVLSVFTNSEHNTSSNQKKSMSSTISPSRASVAFTLLRLWHTYHDERRAAVTHTLSHLHTFGPHAVAQCARGSATGLAPLPAAIYVDAVGGSGGADAPSSPPTLLSLFSVLPHLHLYAHCSFAAPQPPSPAVFSQLTSPAFLAYALVHEALSGEVLPSLDSVSVDASQRVMARAAVDGVASVPAIAALMRGATDQGMTAVINGAQSILQELHFAYLHWMLSLASDSALAPLLFTTPVEAFLLSPPHASSEATTALTLAWQRKIAKVAVESVETQDNKEQETVFTGMRGKLPHGPKRIVANRYTKLARDGFAAIVSQLRVMDPLAQTG